MTGKSRVRMVSDRDEIEGGGRDLTRTEKKEKKRIPYSSNKFYFLKM